MQVEGAQPWRVEHSARQDLAERDHHGGVEPERPERFDFGRVAHRGRRADHQALLDCKRVHRGGLQHLPAAAWRRRLRIDAGDLVPGLDDAAQGGEREVGGPKESDARVRRFYLQGSPRAKPGNFV